MQVSLGSKDPLPSKRALVWCRMQTQTQVFLETRSPLPSKRALVQYRTPTRARCRSPAWAQEKQLSERSPRSQSPRQSHMLRWLHRLLEIELVTDILVFQCWLLLRKSFPTVAHILILPVLLLRVLLRISLHKLSYLQSKIPQHKADRSPRLVRLVQPCSR